MLPALGPAPGRDMYEAINAVFDLDERAEVSEIADATFDDGPGRIGLGEMLPWVLEQLLHAERNPTVVRVDGDHDGLDFIAGLDHLRRMLHPLGPGHLVDV